jgi:DNA-binding SARP family transcriptional activator/TolB-like protein
MLARADLSSVYARFTALQTPMAMRSLKLFGGVAIEGRDGPLTGPATQRHRLALLALLAASYPRALPRDKLVAYLWPERDAEHARNLLNQAVHAVRKALGEGSILTGGAELRFGAGAVECDVIAFTAALEGGDWQRAAGLYAGPFLDGFFLSDAPEFERWAEAERESLSGAYAKALESLAEAVEEAGDVTGAVEWWKARAAHDPYDSRVTLRLMQALEASGNRAGALQHAALHQRLLENELGIERTPEVAKLAERMSRHPAEASLASGSRPTPARSTVGSSPASSGSSERPAVAESPEDPEKHASARRDTPWRWPVGLAAVLAALVFTGRALMDVPGGRSAEIQRIAVLPLANLTGDASLDYFVAGMHDALIAELAQIGELTVYSRQSVLRYQDSMLPLPTIARELGADALVEGSVFRSGDSVRITVQLVRARPDEAHLWTASHQGAMSGALALQGEVAHAIAQAIHARLSPAVQARLARQHTRDPAAQQAYLRGLYHLERGSYGQLMPASDRLVEHRTAIEHLEEAAGLDPGWAAAHAKLALAYHWVASGYGSRDEAEFYAKSKAAALRALELDDTEAQAHASLGFVLFMYDWDWAGAELAIRRALELDPNSHHWIAALYLQAAGRHDEAIQHFRLAEERNPLSEGLSIQIANALACAGRHDEAMLQSEQLQARMQAFGDAHPAGNISRAGPVDFRALEYSMAEKHAEAIAAAEAAVTLSDSLPGTLTNLAFVYARAGHLHEAWTLADRLKEEARVAGRIWRAEHLYAALGDTGRALDMLEASLEGQRGRLVHRRCSYVYQMLRDHPRMEALVQPVGFPR